MVVGSVRRAVELPRGPYACVRRGARKFRHPAGRLSPGGVLLVTLNGGQAAYWAQ
ncbi:hypothetical protein GCM10018772_68650 [Streptomyces fumanus]|uniref:Uncharacterized protein n=1 Tax=Streptomyces fumanus TaxID=67302 RepID=A0A919EA30_9ACTN|nr:hypothetical protein GCM10018772_68650 [Streptomyces fumanus]